MAHEELVYKYAEMLRVFDKHTGAEALPKSPWRKGTSTINNFYKACVNLAADGKLEQCDGFFRVNYCKADWNNPHTQQVSKCVAALLSTGAEVYREILVSTIGTRPDAIALVRKGGKGRCCILEVCLTETAEYLESKINAWHGWKGAEKYLSELFGIKIPFFDIVVHGLTHPKAIPYEEFMKEVK